MSESEDEVSFAPLPMRALIRRHDWSATSLGAYDAWPQVLRITVDIMLSAGHAMCVMWGAERTFLYNDAYASFLADRHPGALGLSAAAVWQDVWRDIAPLVERTFAGETYVAHELPLTMIRNGVPEQTWWDFCYSPLFGEGGAVAGLLNVCTDCTARVIALQQRDAAMAELRDSEAFVRSVLVSSTDCIKVIELDGTLSFMNDGGMEIMQISDFNQVQGCAWADLLKDDGPILARNALEAARQGRSTHFLTPADTLAGAHKFWSVSVSPIPGDDGRPNRILAVSRDITELEQAREQQRMLNGELAHRIKNTMSVVQAIARQTLGKAADKDAMRAFEARLAALAASHNLLTRQNWSTASLDDLIREAVSTFGAERFTRGGPPVVMGSRATLALSLMLHELATNAVKYGALSVPEGRVAVEWAVHDGVFHLTWRERGGPPAVEPTHAGFGSRIIRMGLIGSGGVKLSYDRQGLSVEATAPLHQVQEA